MYVVLGVKLLGIKFAIIEFARKSFRIPILNLNDLERLFY